MPTTLTRHWLLLLLSTTTTTTTTTMSTAPALVHLALVMINFCVSFASGATPSSGGASGATPSSGARQSLSHQCFVEAAGGNSTFKWTLTRRLCGILAADKDSFIVFKHTPQSLKTCWVNVSPQNMSSAGMELIHQLTLP